MTDLELLDIIKKKYNIYFLPYKSLRDIYYDFEKKESAYFLNADDEIEGIKIKGYSLIEIPEELKDFEYLRVLSMPDNNIQDISIVAELNELAVLKMNFNKVEDLQPLKNHNKLKWLELKFNRITDISAVAKTLS